MPFYNNPDTPPPGERIGVGPRHKGRPTYPPPPSARNHARALLLPRLYRWQRQSPRALPFARASAASRPSPRSTAFISLTGKYKRDTWLMEVRAPPDPEVCVICRKVDPVPLQRCRFCQMCFHAGCLERHPPGDRASLIEHFPEETQAAVATWQEAWETILSRVLRVGVPSPVLCSYCQAVLPLVV